MSNHLALWYFLRTYHTAQVMAGSTGGLCVSLSVWPGLFPHCRDCCLPQPEVLGKHIGAVCCQGNPLVKQKIFMSNSELYSSLAVMGECPFFKSEMKVLVDVNGLCVLVQWAHRSARIDRVSV